MGPKRPTATLSCCASSFCSLLVVTTKNECLPNDARVFIHHTAFEKTRCLVDCVVILPSPAQTQTHVSIKKYFSITFWLDLASESTSTKRCNTGLYSEGGNSRSRRPDKFGRPARRQAGPDFSPPSQDFSCLVDCKCRA